MTRLDFIRRRPELLYYHCSERSWCDIRHQRSRCVVLSPIVLPSRSLLTDGPFRIHNATCFMAGDAVLKDRQDRETEMRKARGIVELFPSVFLHQSRELAGKGNKRVARPTFSLPSSSSLLPLPDHSSCSPWSVRRLRSDDDRRPLPHRPSPPPHSPPG